MSKLFFMAGTGYICILFLIYGTVGAETDSLISFSLQDQFDSLHTDQDYEDQLTILIASDKKGEPYNEMWGEVVENHFADSVQYKQLLVADLEGAPRFIKRFLVSILPKDRPVLLDWKGVFDKAYSLTPEKSNILVFSPAHTLVFRFAAQQPQESTTQPLKTALTQSVQGIKPQGQ